MRKTITILCFMALTFSVEALAGPKCTDTDPNNQKNVQGKVTLPNGMVSYDTCWGAGRLSMVQQLDCSASGTSIKIQPKVLCSDNNVCNGVEECQKGACVVGNPLKCDDGNKCNGTETCDPVSGCKSGTPLQIDDNNLCTADSCDPATGVQHVAKTCASPEVCNPVTGKCKKAASPLATCKDGDVMGWKKLVGNDGKELSSGGWGKMTFVSYNGNLCVGFSIMGGISCYKDGKWQPFNKGFPVFYAAESPEAAAIGVIDLQVHNGALYFAGWWPKSHLATPSDLFEDETMKFSEEVFYGLYLTNEKEEWLPISIAPVILKDIASFNSKVYAGTVDGIYSYSNGVWSKEGLQEKLVSELYTDGTALYAGTKDGVYRYTNGVWEQIGLNGTQIYSIFEYNNFIYAATTTGIYRQESNSWQKIDLSGVYLKPAVYAGKLYIGNGSKVYYSDDGLSNWKDDSIGLEKWYEGGINVLLEHDGNLYLAGSEEAGLGGIVVYQHTCMPKP